MHILSPSDKSEILSTLAANPNMFASVIILNESSNFKRKMIKPLLVSMLCCFIFCSALMATPKSSLSSNADSSKGPSFSLGNSSTLKYGRFQRIRSCCLLNHQVFLLCSGEGPGPPSATFTKALDKFAFSIDDTTANGLVSQA